MSIFNKDFTYLVTVFLTYLSIFYLQQSCNMAKSIRPKTRNTDKVWLIRHPCKTVNRARLPCSQDVMKNLVHYNCKMKLTLSENAQQVCNLLLPVWIKP